VKINGSLALPLTKLIVFIVGVTTFGQRTEILGGYVRTFLNACTATATTEVMKDIRETLKLEQCPCHRGSFDRSNIFYKVCYKDVLDGRCNGGAIRNLVAFIKRQHARAERSFKPCSGIIYVHTRFDTQLLAQQLQEKTGLRTAGYHGGQNSSQRSQIQQDWTSGVVMIAIATVAFGMGIDLAHVRYVVHWSMPKTIEGFYQESGRAGRDGLPSYSLLYFSKNDAQRFEQLVKENNRSPASSQKLECSLIDISKVVEYATAPVCRRQYLLEHFGEIIINPDDICRKRCDFCQNPEKLKKDDEATNAVTVARRY
jgi:RecQ family ATP-dependent DNA helicase